MPTLTLTVSAAVASRIQDAYGATDLADLKSKVIADIKNRVIGYEANLVDEAEAEKVDTAQEARRTAVDAAVATAEAEVSLT